MIILRLITYPIDSKKSPSYHFFYCHIDQEITEWGQWTFEKGVGVGRPSPLHQLPLNIHPLAFVFAQTNYWYHDYHDDITCLSFGYCTIQSTFSKLVSNAHGYQSRVFFWSDDGVGVLIMVVDDYCAICWHFDCSIWPQPLLVGFPDCR